METGRTKKFVKNSTYGLVNKIFSLLISFVLRTLLIKYLGANYLGIDGLFISILTVLSLADLGFESAMIYGMYKPLASHDQKLLAALVNYYKKVYYILGGIILGLGLMVLPFLNLLIHLDTAVGNIYVLYLLFLLNSVITYFFRYKNTVLTADQKDYIPTAIGLLVNIVRFGLQIVALVVFHNYIAYLCIQVVATFVIDVIIAIVSGRTYSFFGTREQIDKETKKQFTKNISALFVYKIFSSIVDNFSSIFISVIVGTIVVGYYSNYNLILMAVAAIINVVLAAFVASVGNFIADPAAVDKEKLFFKLQHVAFIFYAVAAPCLYAMFNDFILIWTGEAQYTLANIVVITMVLNFVISGLTAPVWIFRDTSGLFLKTKYIAIFFAIVDIILSLILGHFFGLVGILASILIARLLTTFWFEPFVLFEELFHKKPGRYFFNYLKYIVIIVLVGGLLKYTNSFILLGNEYVTFALRCLYCLIVSVLVALVYSLFSKNARNLLVDNIIPLFKKH